MSTFIAPYVSAAKARGEVADDVDEGVASEWVARMFMSLTVMPGSTAFDASKPKSFRAFLERYTVDGLAPHAKRAKRKRCFTSPRFNPSAPGRWAVERGPARCCCTRA
jgi:hypothetical protein